MVGLSDIYERKYQLNTLLTNEVMYIQSCSIRIGCKYKTTFANPVTYVVLAFHVIQLTYQDGHSDHVHLVQPMDFHHAQVPYDNV